MIFTFAFSKQAIRFSLMLITAFESCFTSIYSNMFEIFEANIQQTCFTKISAFTQK